MVQPPFLFLSRINASQGHAFLLAKKLAIANAIAKTTVLLNNQDGIIPLKVLEKKNIASVSLGFAYSTVFDSLANKYDKITSFSASSYKDSLNLNDLEDDLKYFNTILIAIDDQNVSKPRYINFINSISKNKQVIISFFGNGPGLKSFDQLKSPIVWTSQNNVDAAAIVPQYIFGGIAASNKLTTAYSARYTTGAGFTTIATRLKYTLPEDAGVNANNLKEIDAIAAEANNADIQPFVVRPADPLLQSSCPRQM